MKKTSCYECLLFRDHPDKDKFDQFYWCGGFDRQLTKLEARTPNNCPRKLREPLPSENRTVNPLLDRLYSDCVLLASILERPFTIRELIDRLDYSNKNSIWILLEELVKHGKLVKADARVLSMHQVEYSAKTYWPTEWEEKTA